MYVCICHAVSDREIRERIADGTASSMYQQAIASCETCKDYISRELLEDILESGEDHIDWLETRLGLIESTGLQNYLRSQM